MSRVTSAPGRFINVLMAWSYSIAKPILGVCLSVLCRVTPFDYHSVELIEYTGEDYTERKAGHYEVIMPLAITIFGILCLEVLRTINVPELVSISSPIWWIGLFTQLAVGAVMLGGVELTKKLDVISGDGP